VSSPTDPSRTPDFLNHDRPPVPDIVVPRGVEMQKFFLEVNARGRHDDEGVDVASEDVTAVLLAVLILLFAVRVGLRRQHSIIYPRGH
jgi:hypothetical protein